METQVRTPQMVFMQPQRLVVPLFQRPYVWNEENQWEPLWNDLVRVVERLIARPQDKHHPHFLGAVVLQQVQKQTGHMQERTIIDGQQRLTTLQLLLDALHAELIHFKAEAPALRIEPLVRNADPFCSKPEDRFKVWPTNRDRAAFNAVMAAEPPVDYQAVGHAGERMVDAHRYFSDQARAWISAAGEQAVSNRAAAIETAVRDLIQVVVIDLGVDENAQEIFETLNARGAPLTAADLIKNFVFQRLLETGSDVEVAYEENWKEFETSFWEKQINVGRLLYPRSAIFLNHWLIARTGEEVVAREVFDRFKRFANHDAGLSMAHLLLQIHRASQVYRQFTARAETYNGPIDRLGLFGYRTSVLESEVIKPLVLGLLDPEKPKIPDGQLDKALSAVESWMVRRMLVRATTKNYNQIVAELIKRIGDGAREKAGEAIESYLAGQSSGSGYWPDDEELRRDLRAMPVYRRLGRGRLRMVLEALEDDLRGWQNGKAGLGEERVARAKLAIEHVMPRKWLAHWPLDGHDTEADRDGLIHTLGNLTLLTKKLNSKVSNGAWLGEDGKRQGLEGHDVFLLNRDLLKTCGDHWTDDGIRRRTSELVERIITIWPVPAGHRSGFADTMPKLLKKVDLADLINAEALKAGVLLVPRTKKYGDRVGTLLPDGRIEIEEKLFNSPSQAATYISGHAENGWWFFRTGDASGPSLRSIRREYLNEMAAESEDDEGDDGRDDEDTSS